MAGSAVGRRGASAPSIKDFIKARPGVVLDALAVLIILLGAGLSLVLYPQIREEAVNALAYGMIPVGLWVTAVLVALRYYPHSLVRHWRQWTVGTLAVAVALGAMSFVDTDDSLWSSTGLSGSWGTLIAGDSLALAALKLAVIVVLTPLLLYPRRLGVIYYKGGRTLWAAAKLGALYLYLAIYFAAHYLGQFIKHVRTGKYPSSIVNGIRRVFSFRPGTGNGRSGGMAEGDGPNGRVESQTWPEPDRVEPHDPPSAVNATPVKVRGSKWALPSIECLAPAEHHEQPMGPLEEMARNVETTLAEHGVAVEVKDIKSGPRIIQFGLAPGWVSKKGEGGKDTTSQGKPDSRVKVQSILTREKDLALALKTPYLRIEPSVPGEGLVGLEVPAPSPGKVHLREVMESQEFQKIVAKGGLPVAMGKDSGGNASVVDLSTLPHLLIAGATGSGKSVCTNSVVASLLLTKPPDQLRLLMVDPKRVELTPFNGIPHLIMPVIVDVDKVNSALQGLMKEMLRRYKQMEESGVRNISGYNAQAKEPMPFLLLIVDELADLMMAGGYDIEQNLVRLAQLGRAAGIHLVLATQRPSVNVVTGLLKANVPARVAFAVASQVDSRVILDTVGAERLLGKGDMLLLNSDSPKPRRVQGTLVYDEEIDKLVKFWKSQEGGPLPQILLEDDDDEEDEDGEINEHMLDQAREIALRSPRLTVSVLERRLKVGKQRAEEVLEHLEDEGLVMPR